MARPAAAVKVWASAPSTTIALRRSAFVPLVGDTFEIIHQGGSLPVVLRQVTDLKPTLRPGAEDQFSLMFTDARLRPALQDGTYGISHPRHGRIALFVTPIDRPQTTQHYQAVINHSVRKAIN
jgi:hypothetical protein